MTQQDRPADLATLATVECTGCHWSLIGDGTEAARVVLDAAEDHAARTGHELTTLGLVPGNGDAASVLAQLMPESAELVAGGYYIRKEDGGA